MEWNIPVVHGLIMRKVTGKGLNALDGANILLGGRVKQFTKEDFSLITHLSCHDIPKYNIQSNELIPLLAAYFHDKKPNIYELEAAFKNCPIDEDHYKLGMVYFVEAVLLAREYTSLIHLQYLKMVEDNIKWNDYP